MAPARPHAPLVPALVSPRFDLVWFVGPGLLAIVYALIVGSTGSPRSSALGLWVVGVLLVDVVHVYASLYRTYFDRQARALHRKRLLWTPVLCFLAGVLLHLQSSLAFWGVLAYVAIFHFIKQHIGFAMLLLRAGRESAVDRKLVTTALWAGTLGPVIYWHAQLPRAFAWFMQGDLVQGLPAAIALPAAILGLLPTLVFVARRLWLRRHGHRNPTLVALVLMPVATWYLGIVVFDDDHIFTVTNVFAHGVPYLALVWLAGGRTRVERGLGSLPSRLGTRAVVLVAAAFYGLLVVLGGVEELLWDRLVWHEHAMLFGHSAVDLTGIWQAVVVAALTVPQATHYVLDRYIWRVGPSNPKLSKQLGFE